MPATKPKKVSRHPIIKVKRPIRSEPQSYPGDPAPDGIQNRALSIRQPHVEAIFRGIKKVEYRTQPTRIRGQVYLYASLKSADLAFYGQYGFEPGSLKTGMLLGTVEVVACTGVPGNYEWHLANPQRLAVPIKPERHPQPAWFRPFVDEATK